MISEGYKARLNIKKIYTQAQLKKAKLKEILKLFDAYKGIFLKSDPNIKAPLISLILFMQSRLTK